MRTHKSARIKPRASILASIILAAVLPGLTAVPCGAGQKARSSATPVRNARAVELISLDQLKERFQDDAGKVRLVVLVSPT